MKRRVRGVILDIDGTLLNSNDAHARAWQAALAESGIERSFVEIRRLIGMGGDQLLPAIAGIDEDSPEGERISRARARIFEQKYLPEVRAFPATRQLIVRMQGAGIRLAVASSAKKPELTRFLRIAGIDDLIEAATSSSDAERSKPDPQIVRAALAALDLAAASVLMLGDTPYDIQAAQALGIDTIALRCGGRSRADLAGAIAIYDDPSHLLASFDESPLAS